MNKVLEFNGREGDLLKAGLKLLKVEKAKLLSSDDQGVRRIGREVVAEIDNLLIDIDHADLA